MADDGAPYPASWEADVAVRDGSVMHIRPIRPDDAPALQRFHVAQSPRSTYFRFFGPKARLSDADLVHLTGVDHVDRVALVLVHGSEILAVGRYDRLDDEVAEVAFNVADRLQGLGLGSVLLEHLAAAARERGIRRFVADVLPTNSRMLRVFRDAGYDVHHRLEEGVITVAFDVDPTARSVAVMAEREHRADALSMRAVLGAGSVVVVAEGEPAPLARRAAQNALAAAPAGAVHLVGPALAGIPGTWWPTLDDVPAPLDLAVVAAPEARLAPVVRAVARLGVRGVVVLSGADDGVRPVPEDRRSLVRQARDEGMRVVGPESFGLVARGEAYRLDVSLARALPPDGGVSLFCQSAAAGLAMLDGARARGLGLATFLSAGHRADVSGNDAMQFWSDHEPTRVGCVYLESIGNPRKFTRVARRLSARIPVVGLVSGQTGQAVPPGHEVRTSREPRRVLDELLRQSGVIRTSSMAEMLDVAQLLSTQPVPSGDRVAVVSNSGSLGALVADVARAGGLRAIEPLILAPFAPAAAYEAALRRVRGRTDWDALVVVHSPPLGETDSAVAAAIAAAAADDDRPVVTCTHGLHGVPAPLRVRTPVGEAAVPAFAGVEEAVRALARAAAYGRWLAGAESGPLAPPSGTDPRRAHGLVRAEAAGMARDTTRPLSPEAVATLLGCYGVEVWPARLVRSAEEAVAAADDLGWPVAVKSGAPHLRHRLDLGGVRLDVADAGDLRAVADELLAGEHGGPAVLAVQSMAPRGVACVVRAVEDELYGPVLSFGVAGDASELLGDVAYRIPPIGVGELEEMVRSVRAAPRLLGHGGAPPVDLAPLVDLLARVAALKDDLPEVAEVVLNPVLVGVAGAVTLEAEVVLAQPRRVDGARRVLPA